MSGPLDVALLGLFANIDQFVRVALIRTTILNQLAAANSKEWRDIYQRALDSGMNVADAEARANELVPPMTAEDDAAIASGESDGSDVAGNAPDASLTDEERIAALDYWGARVWDPSLDPEGGPTLNEGMMQDPSDNSDNPRRIIYPSNIDPIGIGALNDAFGGIDQDDDEWKPGDPYPPGWQEQKSLPLNQTDPYIRTPSRYRLDPGLEKSTALSRRFGGTLLPESDQPWDITNDAFDQNEIDFINRAQGGATEGVNAARRGGYDERSTYWSGREQRNIIDLPGAVGPTYRESDVLDMISSMSTVQIIEFQRLAGDAGFYGSDQTPDINGYMSYADQQVLATVMGQSNVSGETVWPMLGKMAKSGIANRGSGVVKEPFSVPAHLRAIPGEKTVAQEVKARFRQEMGRDARDDELNGIANELTGYYTKSNQEEIALYLAAYNGDNQGLLTGAQMQRIEDPGAATSFDIGEKWANEIDLNKRRETNADSFSRMLAATMGNRPSVGNLTAAGGVQTIQRGI